MPPTGPSGPSPRKQKKVEFDPAEEEDSDGDEAGESEFDEATQKALEDIDTSQNEIDALNDKASEEILKIEQSYNKLRKPHFDKRNDSISKVNNFWLTAMVHHPQLSLLIDDDVEDCLHFLAKLEVEEFEDIRSGFSIKFYFEENPFFTNPILEKQFHLMNQNKSTSTEIKWNPGMDLTERGAGTGSTGSLKRKRGYQPKDFFSWFLDHRDPSNDDIAEVIKDDLWPNPLQYFLVPSQEDDGNGMEEEFSEEGEDDGVIEGDDGEDNVEGEEEDDGEEGDDNADEEPVEVEGEEDEEEEDDQ